MNLKMIKITSVYLVFFEETHQWTNTGKLKSMETNK